MCSACEFDLTNTGKYCLHVTTWSHSFKRQAVSCCCLPACPLSASPIAQDKSAQPKPRALYVRWGAIVRVRGHTRVTSDEHLVRMKQCFTLMLIKRENADVALPTGPVRACGGAETREGGRLNRDKPQT